MNYRKLYNWAKEVNLNQTKLSRAPLFEVIYRRLSIIITPFFIWLNISPNFISGIVLVLGLISSILISSLNTFNLMMGIILYFIATTVDYVDGNVARMRNISSFYGRFIDGLIDIVVLTMVRISLCWYVMIVIEDRFILLVGIISCIMTPLHHLIYDRYSAIIRWCNEENGTSIKPYIRNDASPRLAFFFIDMQYLFLFSIVFIINSWFLKYALLIYFIINIFTGLHTIIKHVIYSFNSMNISADNHR